MQRFPTYHRSLARRTQIRWLRVLILGLLMTCIGFGQNAPNEFRSGRGGFSIKVDADEFSFALDHFVIDRFHFFSDNFIWIADDYRIVIRASNVSLATGKVLSPMDHQTVLTKSKGELIKQLFRGSPAGEIPFTFEKSKGFEIRGESKKLVVARGAFVNRRMFEWVLTAEDPDSLARGTRALDSFRLLTKLERTVEMIEESAPPALPQERPSVVRWSDVGELGLKGSVKRVRDMTVATKQKESDIIQEIHFDVDGYRVREITFNDGYPDVITAWGWRGVDRINLQGAVNYPDGGPTGTRQTVVSGFQTFGSGGGGPGFGNRISINADESGRIRERRVYSSTGGLVYVETIAYTGDLRETTTRDSSGGFMGKKRETFDKDGILIKIETLSNTGSVVETLTFEHTPDSRGNWIERKEFSGPNPRTRKLLRVVTRDILYHTDDPRLVGRSFPAQIISAL